MLTWIKRLLRKSTKDPEGLAEAKIDRWTKIFQRRALKTGVLPSPEEMASLGISAASDFWKQSNEIPSEGFAVNFSVRLSDLASISSDNLSALDDFGREVDFIPTEETGTSFSFDFTNFRPALRFESDPTPYECLTRIAKFASDAFSGERLPDEAEIYGTSKTLGIPLTRLFWDAQESLWLVNFDWPEQEIV